MSFNKTNRRNRIKRRIRKIILGTNKKPRLSVFRSNKEIYSQIIDDLNGETIISASSREKVIVDIKNSNKVLIAENVGKLLAEKALKKGIKDVVFDRGGYLYHGRVKSLAQGARSGGLKF
tara:strand:+ start:1345 stop:1704 length:360 start_codon:yes stop_codon:yes gene_type:complete